MGPEDFGFNLFGDSEDFTAEEAEGAEISASQEDFAAALRPLLTDGAKARVELRRQGGVYYARVSVGDVPRVYRLNWLVREPRT
jgi:hypothetical protein